MRGTVLVCLLICSGCSGGPPPRGAESAANLPGAAGGPAVVEMPGPAEPLGEPALPAASEAIDLGSRMQVRPLGAPLIDRGATASFELPSGGSGWVTALPEEGLGVTPAYGRGKVFVGGGFASRTMYAMDARTGRIAWRVAAPDGGPSAAIVVEDKVIFNTESCTVFVVAIETGQIIWRRWLGDPLMSQPSAANGRIFSAHPSSGSATGFAMTAMALADGAVLWTQPIPSDVVSAAVPAGDSLYFTTMDGTVHRLRQRDGQEVWSVGLGATTAPWVDGDRVLLARRAAAPAGREGVYEEQVVLGARDGQVIRGGEPVAADHLTGAGRARDLLFRQPGGWGSAHRGREHLGFRNVAEGWAYQGARPTVIDGRAYQVEGDRIQCRDVETGRLLWSRRYAQDAGALAVSPPAVVGAQMVVATVDGHVYGLDIDTGMAVWAYDVGEPVVFQPSVARGWVYLATARGRLVAFPIGDESLDGWHMWGGDPAHEGPLPAAPSDPGAGVAGATDDGPGQGVMSIIDPDEHRIEELPLERTEVDARVSGFVASVTLRQVFSNGHDEPLEAAYHFPLPANAAVDSMTVVIGERRIRGRIERREQARVVYQRARDAGLLAALLEQQRPNLFTQRLANIPPGGQVRVEIHYVQMLPYDAGTYEFVFPMVAGARAEDPTASGPSEPLEQHRPGTRPRDVDVVVRIDAGVPISSLASPSHEVDVERSDDTHAVVRLARSDRIPNRDLVLRYDVAGERPAAAVLSHRDERGGFFTLLVQPAQDERRDLDARRQVTVAIDTSSSLHGPALEQARTVAATVLGTLEDDERFQVVAFSDSVRTFADAPVPATDGNVARGEGFLDGLRALGTTSMTEGLHAALGQPAPPRGALDLVVLVTDGYIASEAEVLRLVNDGLGGRRLFVIGVGPAPNRFLLERLAEVGRGALLVVSPGDAPEVVAQDFIERIAHPQVTDVRIDWGTLHVSDVYPRRVPDLFAGQPLLVHGRFDGDGRGDVVVRGRAGGRAWSETIRLALAEGGSGNEAQAQVWARSAIHDAMSRLYLRDDPAAVDRVTRLGLEFGLVTQFTSFVAVDDRVLAAVQDDDPPPATGSGSVVEAIEGGDAPATAADIHAAVGDLPVPVGSATAAPSPSMPPPPVSDLDGLLDSAVGGGRSPAPTKAVPLADHRGSPALERRASVSVRDRLSRVEIRNVIAHRLGALRAAAQPHRADGSPPVRLTVRLVISPDGRVVSAVVTSREGSTDALERAVLDVLRRMIFPPSTGGTTIVSYPLVL
jgi:Ca-activated chloride channel family protein